MDYAKFNIMHNFASLVQILSRALSFTVGRRLHCGEEAWVIVWLIQSDAELDGEVCVTDAFGTLNFTRNTLPGHFFIIEDILIQKSCTIVAIM